MNSSEKTGAIAAALAKAQGAMQAAELDRANPFFKSKYATLASIWNAIRKPLSDNELAVTQLTYQDDGRLMLETMLLHSSGEWLSAQLAVKPVKDDPQGVGSAISYARRYGLSAIVGAVSDDDDDGNSASKADAKADAKPAAKPTQQPSPPPPGNGHDSDAEFAAMTSASAALPKQPHWIDNQEVCSRFWAWATQHDLAKDDVHRVLGVTHVAEFTGTMGDAKDALANFYQQRTDEHLLAEQEERSKHEVAA